MSEDVVEKVRAHPRYRELVRKRHTFGWQLTALMFVVYYGFILLVAFDKELLASRFGPGVMTLGIPIGFGVIVFTVVLTGIYVRRANGEFDRMTAEILEGVKK